MRSRESTLRALPRVVDPDSPYSALQQRLLFMDGAPHRPWLNLIENVPTWMTAPDLEATTSHTVHSYAPANGSRRLIERIVARENEHYGMTLRSEEVLVTNGGLHALSLIFRASSGERGIALCQAPVLRAIPEMLAAAGYTVRFFSTRDGLDALEAALREHRGAVRLVYVNTPNNPTGRILEASEMRRIDALANVHGFELVVDMVYDAFSFGAASITSPLQCSNDWRHIYVVNSMSKNYGAPGLRVGWVLSSASNVKRLGSLLERELIAASGPSQEHAIRLLEQGNRSLVESVRAGRGVVAKALDAIPNLVYEAPQGGTQFFLELPLVDIEAFCDFALVEFALGLVSGSNYAGIEGPHIRIPIGAPKAVLEQALPVLARAVSVYPGTRVAAIEETCTAYMA